MAKYALTNIKHGAKDGTKSFAVGDEVKGLDKNTMEQLEAAGAVGSQRKLYLSYPELLPDDDTEDEEEGAPDSSEDDGSSGATRRTDQGAATTPEKKD